MQKDTALNKGIPPRNVFQAYILKNILVDIIKSLITLFHKKVLPTDEDFQIFAEDTVLTSLDTKSFVRPQ